MTNCFGPNASYILHLLIPDSLYDMSCSFPYLSSSGFRFGNCELKHATFLSAQCLAGHCEIDENVMVQIKKELFHDELSAMQARSTF
jgi:hypothetical protein